MVAENCPAAGTKWPITGRVAKMRPIARNPEERTELTQNETGDGGRRQPRAMNESSNFRRFRIGIVGLLPPAGGVLVESIEGLRRAASEIEFAVRGLFGI